MFVSRRLGQIVLVLLLTSLIAEVALRVSHYIRPSMAFYDSSYHRFRGRPNALDFHLNSQGFKDVEFDVQKAEGTYRILALGDSFAYGVVRTAKIT